MKGSIEDHRRVQAVAKIVHAELFAKISKADTEQTIAERATELLAKRGIRETWYYDCPAFVLLGSRSCLSISGRDYEPNTESVGIHNLVTVDLSPSLGGVWGDCARSFFVEEGRCVTNPRSSDFERGAVLQTELHQMLREFATPKTTFHQLYRFGNERISTSGFQNLDFLGNLGHSIEERREDRCYIKEGNSRCLGEVELFTFEPHIREKNGAWGFKHENIYYFNSAGRLEEL